MVVNYRKNLFYSPSRMLAVALCVWLALVVAWQIYGIVSDQHRSWLDAWISPDQQGQWYFSQGQYQRAAKSFDNPQWQATAYYAAENFSAAEILWSRQAGYLPLFYRANALAHLERYQEAIDSYQLSLQLKPDFMPAVENLDLVKVLAKKPEEVSDFSGNTGAKLEADDIVFDDADSERMRQATESEQTDSGDLSSEEIQALWMRRLQSKPVDFLRLKFRYQLQQESP